MFATTVALLSVTYQGKDRGIAFGVWGAANGAAAAAGPIIGGLLTEHVGWRAVSLVTLPVAVLAVALARVLPSARARGAGRTDVPGVLSFTVAATLVVYGLI